MKNIENIDECNICLENKGDLGHFKCGCALKVAKIVILILKKLIINVQDVEEKYEFLNIIIFL